MSELFLPRFFRRQRARFVVLGLLSLASYAGAQPDTLWTHSYPQIEVEAVVATGDGGFILAGNTGMPSDAMILCLDPNGETLWERTYGDAEIFEYIMEITRLPDASLLAVGYRYGYPMSWYALGWILHLSAEGDTLWTKTFDDSSESRLFDVVVPDNSCCVIAGSAFYGTPARRAGALWNLDVLTGDLNWYHLYPQDTLRGRGAAVDLTPDGGLLLAGSVGDLDHDDSTYIQVVRTNSDGDALWGRVYAVDLFNYCADIRVVDGGFVLAGSGSQQRYGGNFLVAFCDENGDTNWTRRVPGHASSEANAIIPLSSDEFAVFGWREISENPSNVDYVAQHLSVDGITIWATQYGDIEDDIFCSGGVLMPDGGYLIAGTDYTIPGGGYVVRTTPDVTSARDPAPRGLSFALADCYPNPTNGAAVIPLQLQSPTQVRIALYDMLGRKITLISDGLWSSGSYRVPVNLSPYPSGNYFLSIHAGAHFRSERISLIR